MPVRVLRVGVSPATRDLFATAFERAFEQCTPHTDVQVRADTDRNCIDHLLVGSVDVAVIGTVLSPAERQRGLTEQVLGHRIVVPIIHAENPLRDLRREDVEALIAGEHRTWHAVGWEDLPVLPVCLAASGVLDPATEVMRVTGKALDGAVFQRTEAEVLAFVANTPQALGLVSLLAMQGERHVRVLAMDGVDATLPDYLKGAWRRGATFRAVAKPGHGELVAAWLAFLSGGEARHILQRHLTLE